MNRKMAFVLALMLIMSMCVMMVSCGNKSDEEAAAQNEQTEQTDQGGEDAEGAEDAEDAEPLPEPVKTIDEIDPAEDDKDSSVLPIQIASITLYEDGSVMIVPVEDLRKNELGEDSETDAIYPFADSGKVKDVFVCDYGNGGYRTVLAVLEDGTISAINGRALVEDHIIAVMDGVGGRDDFVSVKNVYDESASGIIGVTEEGQEVLLDNSLNFQ